MKPTSSKMRDVPPLSTKQNMLWNSAGSMTYLACQWLVTVLVVRLSAGYDDAGLLSLAMSVVGIFGTFANYKMGTYQISDIRRENDLAEYLGFRCLTLGLAFVACMVYAYLTCAPYALATIALFFVFKAVGLLIDILHGADQQHRRMDYIGKSFIAQGLSTLAAFVAVFWFTRNLNLAIVGMTASALGVLVLFDIPKAGQFERVCLRLSRSKALFFLKVSFPAVLASLAASAIFAIPKQYLAMTSGDAALGIYASVAAPALVIQMGAMYLYGLSSTSSRATSSTGIFRVSSSCWGKRSAVSSWWGSPVPLSWSSSDRGLCSFCSVPASSRTSIFCSPSSYPRY